MDVTGRNACEGRSAAFRTGVLVLPDFSLMAFASTVEPLRSANFLTGRTLFEWTFLSAIGGAVAASCGVQVPTRAIVEHEPRFQMIVVCASIDPDRHWCEQLGAYLRHAHRRGVLVGAVGTGSFVLARAGLLDGRRCTVHWDYREAFLETFPGLHVTSDLYVSDAGVVTCAGGTAVLDLMLRVVRERHGGELAKRVSDDFIHGVLRDSSDRQRMDARDRLGSTSPLLLRAVEIMESNVESPLTCQGVADAIGTSTRHLERLFKRALGCGPKRHYVLVRLERARRLLRHTTLSVTQVAMACGFDSVSHFSRTYRRYFQVSPRGDRCDPPPGGLPRCAARTGRGSGPKASRLAFPDASRSG